MGLVVVLVGVVVLVVHATVNKFIAASSDRSCDQSAPIQADQLEGCILLTTTIANWSGIAVLTRADNLETTYR